MYMYLWKSQVENIDPRSKKNSSRLLLQCTIELLELLGIGAESSSTTLILSRFQA